MTQTVHRRSPEKMAAASGLVVFAAVMLVIAGVLDIFRGIMGIAGDDLFVTTPQYVFRFDLTGWGWFHLILGFVGVLIGVSLFKAALPARIAGVAIAGFLIIANFLSLPYYPVWSIIAIALYSFVIWALCVVRPETHAR
ncbi:DUF7144 family membrane protein [Streptomyces ureilyticus]|jgi:hypothetical protein|uniref:DUF7144 domain-containing protein n=1 Tax=Streptomyces ureilyticus TaxID=1775131 RepID=A0ABX0DLM2_9ACTN|nr:hypothetical protein [Streptomyces ureilyticus]NGO42330.1 hypothetical protein [Streptomyces ureilyticus]